MCVGCVDDGYILPLLLLLCFALLSFTTFARARGRVGGIYTHRHSSRSSWNGIMLGGCLLAKNSNTA